MSDDLRPNFLTCPAVPELPEPTVDVHVPLEESSKEVSPTVPELSSFEANDSSGPAPQTVTADVASPTFPTNQLPRKRPRSAWQRFILIACGLFVAAAVLIFGVVIYGAVFLGGAVADLRGTTQTIRADVEKRDFIAAEDELPKFQAALGRLSDGIDQLQALRGWPLIGADIRTLDHVMEIAHTLSDGVDQTVRAASSFEHVLQSVGVLERGLDGSIVSGRSFASLSPSEKEQILSRFANLLPELRQAREKVRLAASLWTDLPAESRSSSFMAPLASYGERLPELTKRADQLISFLDLLLPLVGHPSENRYLVVLQNSDELRPTGGFLGTIGYVRVQSADIKEMRFDDVYAIDNPVSGVWKQDPPAPLKKYLAVSQWFLRDHNWSPDFPTSAQDIMQTYLAERRLVSATTTDRLDGMIAFTPRFFEDVLRFTGPIRVDGKTFSADNFFDQLQYDTEMGFATQGISVDRRKDIVLHLGDALMQALMHQSTDRIPTFLDLLSDNLAEKNVMFYLHDPRTLSLLDGRGWTGRVAGPTGDYLWIVDSNLAALKTDGKMQKQATYSVDMNTGIATLTLRYHNTVRQIDWRYTRYRDYVRIYVPEGSELISSRGALTDDRTRTGGREVPGAIDVMHELGKTVFGAFWAIEPSETRELQFTYRLPANVLQAMQSEGENGGYHLTVQRQPGNTLELTLDDALGKNVRAADPGEAPQDFGDQRYHLTVPLDRDRTFRVRF